MTKIQANYKASLLVHVTATVFGLAYQLPFYPLGSITLTYLITSFALAIYQSLQDTKMNKQDTK